MVVQSIACRTNLVSRCVGSIDTGHQKSACRMHISAWQQLGCWTNGADGCSVLETRNAQRHSHRAKDPTEQSFTSGLPFSFSEAISMLAQLEAPHSHTHTHSWQPTPLPLRMLASTHSMLKTANTGQGCKLQDMALARSSASPGERHLLCRPEAACQLDQRRQNPTPSCIPHSPHA